MYIFQVFPLMQQVYLAYTKNAQHYEDFEWLYRDGSLLTNSEGDR